MAKILMLGIIIAIVYFFILPRFQRPKNSDKKIQNFDFFILPIFLFTVFLLMNVCGTAVVLLTYIS